MTEFNLGDTAKDSISGFKGIITSRHEFLNGCVRYGISPQSLDKDGKVIDALIFDQEQMVLIKAAKKPKATPSGGPRDMPRTVVR